MGNILGSRKDDDGAARLSADEGSAQLHVYKSTMRNAPAEPSLAFYLIRGDSVGFHLDLITVCRILSRFSSSRHRISAECYSKAPIPVLPSSSNHGGDNATSRDFYDPASVKTSMDKNPTLLFLAESHLPQ